MKKRALLNWLVVDRASRRTLNRQICDQLREAILEGRLDGGITLPSTRGLAKDIGVSRITTLHAYEQLVAEGFLEASPGAGTRVSMHLGSGEFKDLNQARAQTRAFVVEDPLRYVSKLYGDRSANLAFQPGIPAFDRFPHLTWSKLLAKTALRQEPEMLDYAHIGGYGPLREEIAAYLQGSRGVECDPAQVIVVTSVRTAIAAVSAVLWNNTGLVAVEDPGYRIARVVLARNGHDVLPVPTDADGMQVSRLGAAARGCVGAYTTPAHHWPSGVTLSARRRAALLNWAVQSGAWIIEDDYDSEFRFDSPPLGTLYGMNSGRVVYVGTFSKTIAPSLRTAYLVVPKHSITAFEKFTYEAATEPALHVQAALSSFMAEGYFTRHIARMRKLYGKRRSLLVAALAETFGDRLSVHAPPGGLQITANLPERVPAKIFSAQAAQADLLARSTFVNFVDQPPDNALQLGFAAIPEADILPLVQRLDQATRHLF